MSGPIDWCVNKDMPVGSLSTFSDGNVVRWAGRKNHSIDSYCLVEGDIVRPLSWDKLHDIVLFFVVYTKTPTIQGCVVFMDSDEFMKMIEENPICASMTEKRTTAKEMLDRLENCV